MPVNISFQPAAAAVGGLGLLGGQGDYAKWLNQYNLQRWQAGTNVELQAAQMAQSRMLALAQMANQAQQQQQQQFFDLQKMPYQAAIEAQQQAYQYGLAGQNQAQLAQLQGQIHADQSARDFDEQKQLIAAQGQAGLGNQMEMARFNDQLKQQQQVEALFQNPLAQHLQNVQKAQQAGYSFAPEQQQQVGKLKGDIQAIQNAVNDGTVTRGTALPALRQKVAQLNALTPSQPPPETTQQRIDKNVVMGVRGPDGQIIPGTESTPFTVDAKDGTPMVVRGWRPPEPGEINPDTGEYESERARGLRLGNQKKEREVNLHRTEWINKQVQSAMKNPSNMMRAMQDPTYEQQLRAQFSAEYDQSANMTPSGVMPVGPATQPGQSPNAPQPGQPPAGGAAPGAQPAQGVNPVQQAQQDLLRLRQTPVAQWTLEDWARYRQIKAAEQQIRGSAA